MLQHPWPWFAPLAPPPPLTASFAAFRRARIWLPPPPLAAAHPAVAAPAAGAAPAPGRGFRRWRCPRPLLPPFLHAAAPAAGAGPTTGRRPRRRSLGAIPTRTRSAGARAVGGRQRVAGVGVGGRWHSCVCGAAGCGGCWWEQPAAIGAGVEELCGRFIRTDRVVGHRFMCVGMSKDFQERPRFYWLHAASTGD